MDVPLICMTVAATEVEIFMFAKRIKQVIYIFHMTSDETAWKYTKKTLYSYKNTTIYVTEKNSIEEYIEIT